MTPPTDLAAPGTFAWALGIEDTFIPQLAPGGRILDEYVLTQHDRFWRDDLRRIADTGTRHLRYGIPWYRVNPAPGVFDFSWTDQVLPYLVSELGIAPILDLVHYGAPEWLEGTFVSPDYPGRIAEYASAVAARSGAWPPHRRGDRGYAAVTVSLAEGIARTIDAIRAEVADPLIVHVEAMNSIDVPDPDHEPAALVRRELPYLASDLAEGRL